MPGIEVIKKRMMREVMTKTEVMNWNTFSIHLGGSIVRIFLPVEFYKFSTLIRLNHLGLPTFLRLMLGLYRKKKRVANYI